MGLQSAYLIGSLALLVVWLVLFAARRDLRADMIWTSVLVGVLSPLTAYAWWNVDWWRPPTVTGTQIGFEDVLMGFAAGGIMAVAYQAVCSRRNRRRGTPRRNQAALLLLFLALVTSALFWGLGLTSFWASTVALISAAALLYALRPDLVGPGIASGALMALISLIFYAAILSASADWIAATYVFDGLSGRMALGVPIEEFVFWFLAGAFYGPLYEYRQSLAIARAPRSR
jgi:hypothetical protein